MNPAGKDALKPGRLQDAAYTLFTGVCMGAADVVPGVSGGTIAFVMGIYERLLAAIKRFDLELLRLVLRGRIREALGLIPWWFLVPLALGIGGSIFTLAHAVTYLFEHHPDLLLAFFFGLVVASIYLLVRVNTWRTGPVAGLIAGALIGFAIVRLAPQQLDATPLVILLAGSVAICAMILPGISGSFILYILGLYTAIMEAVKSFDFGVILPFGAGAAFGLMGFARVLEFLLKRYHAVTLAVMTGFMAGSLWKIWPWRRVLESITKEDGEVVVLRDQVVGPHGSAGHLALALGLMVAGAVLILLVDRIHRRVLGRMPGH